VTEPDSTDGGADAASAEVQDGVEHLQAAAHEMIAAGRAFLDAVEDVVRDRDAVASVVDAFGSIAHGWRPGGTGPAPRRPVAMTMTIHRHVCSTSVCPEPSGPFRPGTPEGPGIVLGSSSTMSLTSPSIEPMVSLR